MSAPYHCRSSVPRLITDSLMSWRIKSPGPHTQTAMKVRRSGMELLADVGMGNSSRCTFIYSFLWAFCQRRPSLRAICVETYIQFSHYGSYSLFEESSSIIFNFPLGINKVLYLSIKLTSAQTFGGREIFLSFISGQYFTATLFKKSFT